MKAFNDDKSGKTNYELPDGNIVTLGSEQISCVEPLFNPGFADRFWKEITKLGPKYPKVRIIAPPERTESVWIGASIQTSLQIFENQWITKEGYQESGGKIIHKKCD